MNANLRISRTTIGPVRDGAAAVELALVAPVLVLLVLGVIDVGQFANVHLKVSDASRAGARVAARFETLNVSEVEAAVFNYLQTAFPDVPEATLNSAIQVKVEDLSGGAVIGNIVASIPPRSSVVVRVTLQFDAVRWIIGIPDLAGQQVQSATVMRRE